MQLTAAQSFETLLGGSLGEFSGHLLHFGVGQVFVALQETFFDLNRVQDTLLRGLVRLCSFGLRAELLAHVQWIGD